MPKKQKQPFYQSKPATSYVHPSLATSAAPQESAPPTSVNDRLEYLRRAQGHQIQQKDLSFSQYAPRPVQRRVAGPPPPRSWLVTSRDDDDAGAADRPDGKKRLRPPRLGAFPGTSMPARDSLMHQLLQSIATDIEWHAEFDGPYLALLPLSARTQLLSYVSMIGPDRGVSMAALKCVFSIDEELESQGAASPDEVKRLDLGGSIGRAISLRELEKSWTHKSKARAKAKQATEEVLDSWEEEVDLAGLTLKSPLWFPSLTHLSLAYPSPSASWTDLLSFSRNLSALTHLSLAGWPRPALTAASQAPGQSQELTVDDAERHDARVVLSFLSRSTPSLQWLSFSRCHDWFDVLSPNRPDSGTTGRAPGRQRRAPGAASHAISFGESGGSAVATSGAGGAEWTGSWRHLRHIELSQEWVPAGVSSHDLHRLVQGRSKTFQGAPWASEARATAPREAELYTIIAPTEEMRRSMEQQRARREWVDREHRAVKLLAKIRAVRLQHALSRCEIDLGWGRPELLRAGYDERVVFEAGL